MLNNKITKAPEKIFVASNLFPTYVDWDGSPVNTKRIDNDDVEYTRTDAFIEKALKWYCFDCACNNNCKYKCAFWNFFKDYLEGNDNALPPKIENAFNPDGSTTENYRYRHFRRRMQDDFIEKVAEFLKSYRQETYDGTGYIAGIVNDETIEDFRNYMKGE